MNKLKAEYMVVSKKDGPACILGIRNIKIIQVDEFKY